MTYHLEIMATITWHSSLLWMTSKFYSK